MASCAFSIASTTSFADFLHLAFDHDNAVKGASDHDVHVCFFEFRAKGLMTNFRSRATRTSKWGRQGTSDTAMAALAAKPPLSAALPRRRSELNHDLRSSVVVTWEHGARHDHRHILRFGVGRTSLWRRNRLEAAGSRILLR